MSAQVGRGDHYSSLGNLGDFFASGLNNCLGDVCGALEVPEQPLWGREGTP